MRRTAEDSAATRAALVDAALIAFARDGVESATLAGIAAAAGVTRGALYHHFADKDALLAAVLAEQWDVVAAPVWAALDPRGTALADRLEAFALAWLTALHTDRHFTALMTVSLRAAGGAFPTQEKAAGLRAWHDRLLAALTRDRADLRGDPAPAAAHLLAWLSGTALLAGHDPDLVPPADAASVRPVLGGILA
ncbi:TetR/AcrR family transcriptional regulator [Pseudonocardia sp. MH-G8]|uniref:TetR/AcrR family transcriptional regulator n=1 Tax=Pseudonocardia sp. MH-G8 TaxID=1854588 RepID=UPI000B9FB405|nr:TetR/AcrR family transcriptional regulator [Pseudonocardia sp. MH-G8]OZM80229.1 TetR family transcriptional regulator [Pseudonocardia sp. MH-G8]